MPFKYVEEIPKEKGKISQIRTYWEKFVRKLSSHYSSKGNDVEIIEKPLWQFDN